MRHVLRDLWPVTTRRRKAAKPEPRAKLRAIVAANFDAEQVSGPVMKTWLAFWSESMHKPDCDACSASTRGGCIRICVRIFRAC